MLACGIVVSRWCVRWSSSFLIHPFPQRGASSSAKIAIVVQILMDARKTIHVVRSYPLIEWCVCVSGWRLLMWPNVACVHVPSECVSSYCSFVWTYNCKLDIRMMVIYRIPIAYGNVNYYCAYTTIRIRIENVWSDVSFYPFPLGTTNLEWNSQCKIRKRAKKIYEMKKMFVVKSIFCHYHYSIGVVVIGL